MCRIECAIANLLQYFYLVAGTSPAETGYLLLRELPVQQDAYPCSRLRAWHDINRTYDTTNMMAYPKTHLFFGLLLAVALGASCVGETEQQAADTKMVQYKEPADPYPAPDSVWDAVPPGVNLRFGSADEHYARSAPPRQDLLQANWRATGWRGERVHTQALLWTAEPLRGVKLAVEKLRDDQGNEIAPQHIKAEYLRYVLTDHLGDLANGCGIPAGLDTSIVADVIDNTQYLDIGERTTRPIWLSVSIPQDAVPGTYSGTLRVEAARPTSNRDRVAAIPFQIEVLPHVLPAPQEWGYHLDLWQNPFAVARYYQVRIWSDDHFRGMRPYMRRLADAGQKVITASIIHDPWNSQTYDVYSSMVKWTKRADGTWVYDFANFDRWVEFMMGFGVDKFINCYSMIPWNLKFHYHDEALGKDTVLVAEPGSPEYRAHWLPMLTDFARHLKAKGWWDITTIAMDERPMEAMQHAIAIIKEADPDFKVSLAGTYHPELSDALVDFSITSPESMDEETLARRNELGYTTTFYTCCVEPRPNTFTSSPYAEATWLAWHALHKGYGGYLRWAYNSWNERPLWDSRYGTWAGGDTYLVYPGFRTSVRFERLREGIQDYEKFQIISRQLQEQGREDDLARLLAITERFALDSLNSHTAASAVNYAKNVLNSF